MSKLKNIVIVLKRFVHDINDTKISVYAGSLVYITLLSLVPTLALSFSILHGLGVQNQLEPLLVEMLAPIGDRADQIVSSILQFVNNTSVQALGILGVGMILYSGISMVLKLEFAFNQIWGVKETRSIFRRISYYLTMLLLGPVTFFISMASMGSINKMEFIQPLLKLDYFSVPYYFLINILPFLIIIFALFMLYIVVPNHPVKAKSAFYAALITAISWKVSGWVFASFIATSGNYNIIYSSFAVVILFIFWIYLTWLIILAGAMICSQLQYGQYRFYENLDEINPLQVRFIRIMILFRICNAYFKLQKPVTMSDLVDYIGFPVSDVYRLLAELESEKMIILARKKDKQVILPGSKVNALTLGNVLQELDFPSGLLNDLALTNRAKQELEVLNRWYEEKLDHSLTLTEIFIDKTQQGGAQKELNLGD